MNEPTLSHPFLTAASTLLFVAVAFTSGVGAVSLLNTLHAQNQTAAAAEASEAAFPAPFSLGADALLAHAAIVYDPSDGRVLFQKNAYLPLPLASLTKLMTATVVLAGEASDTPITIGASALLPNGDSGLHVGDVLPLSSLLEMSLVASSNDAMQAAAESIGTQYLADMNSAAHNLGLSTMRFYNATGLDESTETAGAYGSAYDMAQLAHLFFYKYPHYFELTTKAEILIKDGSRTLIAQATALPLKKLSGLLGAKTGYTDLAGGNLVAIFEASIGHPLVAVVLGSTAEGRFDDMQALMYAVRGDINPH